MVAKEKNQYCETRPDSEGVKEQVPTEGFWHSAPAFTWTYVDLFILHFPNFFLGREISSTVYITQGMMRR